MVPASSAAAISSSLVAGSSFGSFGLPSLAGEVAPAGVSFLDGDSLVADGEVAIPSIEEAAGSAAGFVVVVVLRSDVAWETSTEPAVSRARRETVRMRLPNRRGTVMRWLHSDQSDEELARDSNEGQR